MNQRADLLRILLADDNDDHAFAFQCGITGLSQPYAFQRVAARAFLAEKLDNFRPNIIVASGVFAQPGELKQVKQLTNGHPILCVVDSENEAEACLAAGAADCVLLSQRDELISCIERHVDGSYHAPHFKRHVVSVKATSLTRAERKLEEIDRRIGAFLRRAAASTRVQYGAFVARLRVGWSYTERRLRHKWKAAKVLWLLQKQKRLTRQNSVRSVRSAQAGYLDLGRASITSRENNTRDTFPEFEAQSLDSFTDRPSPASSLSASSHRSGFAPTESADSDTLRTLELSFKTLFHTALDPMFLLDGLGSFLHANAPGCALLGVSAADLLGKSLLDFVPAEEKAQASATWEALLIEGRQKAEMRFQSAQGELHDILISARSNLWFGVHLLVARDQTELKKLRTAQRQQSGSYT